MNIADNITFDVTGRDACLNGPEVIDDFGELFTGYLSMQVCHEAGPGTRQFGLITKGWHTENEEEVLQSQCRHIATVQLKDSDSATLEAALRELQGELIALY